MATSSVDILSAAAGVNTSPFETEEQGAVDMASSGLYVQGDNTSTEFVVNGGGEEVRLPRSMFLASFQIHVSVLSLLHRRSSTAGGHPKDCIGTCNTS